MPETDPILFELQRLRADVDELLRGEFSYLAAGTYTPTLTNVVNVADSTAYACQYMRVGNVVTVSGRVDIDPTSAAPTATELGISLPVASALTAGTQLAGTAWSLNVSSQGGPVLADTVNDRASYQYLAKSVANAANFFTFTYQIL